MKNDGEELSAAAIPLGAVPASAATLLKSSVTGTINPIALTTVLTPFIPNATVSTAVEFKGALCETSFGQMVNIAADFSKAALTLAFTSANTNANISGSKRKLIRFDFNSTSQLFNSTGNFTRISCTFGCEVARRPSSFSASSGAIRATFNSIYAGDVFRLDFTAPASAVPESAAWAMMILGMGVIGAAMRRHVKVSEVNFTNHV